MKINTQEINQAKGENFINNQKNRDKKKIVLGKVFELAKRPGTEGEGNGAWSKVFTILPQCTRCRKVGAPVEQDISCKLCSGIVKDVCSFIVDHNAKIDAESKKNEKKTGKRAETTASFQGLIRLFKLGHSKESIISAMVGTGLTDSAAKTLYSKLSCVCGAINEPYKKASTVYQAIQFYLYNSGILPQGDKSSIAFVKRVCDAWQSV